VTTPDELRARIAANPQDPTERGRLISDAVEMDMADEIPVDWGIGVGASPEEQPDREVAYDWVWRTQPTDLVLVWYEDGGITINQVAGTLIGEEIFAFSPEPSWQVRELTGLLGALVWADTVADPDTWENFLGMLGDRPVDPVQQMHAWRALANGPDPTNYNIVVGLSPSGFVVVRFGDETASQGHTFIERRDIAAVLNDIEELLEDLEEDES
jgi:hypothetical protein